MELYTDVTPPIMGNQLEQIMGNEMETGIVASAISAARQESPHTWMTSLCDVVVEP